MSHELDVDQLIGWLHENAAVPLDGLAASVNEEQRCTLLALISTCFPSTILREGLSPEEFAQTVYALRENEGEWNRALANAILKADELYSRQDRAGAVEELHQFARQCPWLPYQEIALNQLERYK